MEPGRKEGSRTARDQKMGREGLNKNLHIYFRTGLGHLYIGPHQKKVENGIQNARGEVRDGLTLTMRKGEAHDFIKVTRR